ncbi:MAG: PEP-CTERM sorting domain-containing protein [Rubrivivax sp.]|nr:PEP-CTERM sorting domain-containing protein [Rubrivivax sp.]
MSTSLAKTLKVALLGCVIALGAVRTADAAFVVINADPVYGPEYPGLGWRATGALYIPDGCAISAGLVSYFTWTPFTVTIAGDTSPVDIPLVSTLCAGARLDDATLYFYNTADPLTMVEAISLGDYSPDTPPVANPDDLSQNLIDFSMEDGQVVDFHTSLSVPRRATDFLAGGGANCFSLEFSSDTARLVSFAYENGVCGTTPLNESSNAATVSIDNFVLDSNYTPAPLLPTVATVPEPTSLALVLLALGAAGVGARRARRQAR